MKAITIAIGDEILIGQVVDTNSNYISRNLHSIGIETLRTTAIKDDPDQIVNAIESAFKEVDLVVITGGLGPTKDDLTKKTLCGYFGDELVFNEQVMQHIDMLFKRMGRITASLNREQAMLPKNARLLHNQFGTAPGMIFEKNGKIAVSLPGVPFEMKNLFKQELEPFLKTRYKTPYLVHKTVLTYGLPESELAEKISQWENNLPDDIKLAYLPSPSRVRLRLSSKGENKNELLERIEEQIIKLRAVIGDIIFGFDDEAHEEILARLLTERSLTVCTAESFTGGKIASLLTSIPGSSKYFVGSIISYATRIKTDVLKVDPELIKSRSVVSEEVAGRMAENALRMFGADFAISSTGVAGPEKGEDGNEPGTAILAVASKDETIVQKFNFGQPREKMQGRAVAMSFDLLRRIILGEKHKT